MFYALIAFSSTKSLLSRNKTKQLSFVNLNLNLYSCNIASERSLSLVMNHLFCWSLTLCHCLCLSHLSNLPSTELPSISLGWPGPFCPASDLHEQVCQLVWHHAPDPFSNEAGPSPVQRPGVHTAEKVQGHREAITFLSPPPFSGHYKERARGATIQRCAQPFQSCMDGSLEKQMGFGTGEKETGTDAAVSFFLFLVLPPCLLSDLL